MEKNEVLWVSVWPSGVFSWEKTLPILPMQITWPWPPCVDLVMSSSWPDYHKTKENVNITFFKFVFVYILFSTCQWIHMALGISLWKEKVSLISTYVQGFVFKMYTPLSMFHIFIIITFTIWSYIIPTSIVAIQLKSNTLFLLSTTCFHYYKYNIKQ